MLSISFRNNPDLYGILYTDIAAILGDDPAAKTSLKWLGLIRVIMLFSFYRIVYAFFLFK
jgi:hypothetical protein